MLLNPRPDRCCPPVPLVLAPPPPKQCQAARHHCGIHTTHLHSMQRLQEAGGHTEQRRYDNAAMIASHITLNAVPSLYRGVGYGASCSSQQGNMEVDEHFEVVKYHRFSTPHTNTYKSEAKAVQHGNRFFVAHVHVYRPSSRARC